MFLFCALICSRILIVVGRLCTLCIFFSTLDCLWVVRVSFDFRAYNPRFLELVVRRSNIVEQLKYQTSRYQPQSGNTDGHGGAWGSMFLNIFGLTRFLVDHPHSYTLYQIHNFLAFSVSFRRIGFLSACSSLDRPHAFRVVNGICVKRDIWYIYYYISYRWPQGFLIDEYFHNKGYVHYRSRRGISTTPSGVR